MRQDRFHHGYGTKDVHLELLAQLIHGVFFQRALVAYPALLMSA